MDDYNQDRNIVFSRKVKAGKRTYFFDVKTTKGNDYYINITESKKNFDGGFMKTKVFLYKEDFNKFMDGLQETVAYVKNELMPDYNFDEYQRPEYNAPPAADEDFNQG